MSQLQILFPRPVEVQIEQLKVKVYPVKLRHFELYGKVASGFVGLLDSASIEQITRYAEADSRGVRKLMRVTTSLNRWQIARLPSVAAIALLANVVRVNSGFFADALPGMVTALAGQMSHNA